MVYKDHLSMAFQTQMEQNTRVLTLYSGLYIISGTSTTWYVNRGLMLGLFLRDPLQSL